MLSTPPATQGPQAERRLIHLPISTEQGLMNQNIISMRKNPDIIMSRPTDREAHVMWIVKMFYGDKN